MEAILALEDGRIFRGRSFGAPAERAGEICFNTSMTGYQEVLTDPSYRGQIVCMTCPEIGNYGTNALDQESTGPQVEGFIVREATVLPSNWRATQGLPQYLTEHGIPGICDIDTRALTRHLRTRGAMRGVLSATDRDAESLIEKARNAPYLHDADWVDRVSTKEPYDWSWPREKRWGGNLGLEAPDEELHCVAYDFGIKKNMLNLLRESGYKVTVVPAATSAQDVLAMQPDGVFLSNGPGDPSVPTYAVENIRRLIGEVPMFGICLGHQLAARALGAKTFKLKFGHRGANHPVQDLRTRKVAVTSQNHGYAVDPETLPDGVEMTHVNLNDSTCEGFRDPERKLLAVQYHPESSPGPHDSLDLFREFRTLVDAERKGSA